MQHIFDRLYDPTRYLGSGPRNLPSTLFTAEHKPAHEVAWGTLYKTLPVYFPTEKSPLGEVTARLPLMADGLAHVECDRDVVAIAAYPFAVEYWKDQQTADPVKLEHVPDVAALMKGGDVLFIDYVPVNWSTPAVRERTAQLTRLFERKHGCHYVVHDELCLHPEPLFRNILTLTAHKPTKADPPEIGVVCDAIRRLALPATIGGIKKAILRKPEMKGIFSRLDVGGADVAYSAVMQLHFQGESTLTSQSRSPMPRSSRAGKCGVPEHGYGAL
jgi:hypothetical protein